MLHNILSSQAWAGIAVLVALVGATIRLAGLSKRETGILIGTTIIGLLGTFCFATLQAFLANWFIYGFPELNALIQLAKNSTQTDFVIIVGLSGSVVVFCVLKITNYDKRIGALCAALLGVGFVTGIAALCHFIPIAPNLPDLTITSPDFETNFNIVWHTLMPLWASDIIAGVAGAISAGVVILSD